jgi:hypothetical protein
VVRATGITCTASASPASATLVVTAWRFHADDAQITDIEQASSQEPSSWSGKLVTSGTVTVTATLDGGSPTEKSAHIAVTDRPPLTVNFTAPATSDNEDMSERPYQAAGEEGLFHIGHIHVGRYRLRIPANVEVIGTGPNVGLAYFTGNPYEPTWAVHINLSQLEPGSALGQLQRVSAPAFETVQTCLRSQLPSLVGPIAEHEGTTMHPKSHAGRYASTFNELGGPAIERLVVQQNLNAAVDATLAAVIEAADQESSRADSDFRPSLCRLTLFPAPR